MRVSVLTVGSRGDAQPIIALARGLHDAGHEVTVDTHTQFKALVDANGLRFCSLEGNPRELLESEIGLAWMESANPLRGSRNLLYLVRPLVAGLMRDALIACRSAEAIVFSGIGMAGYHVAEALRVPTVFAALAPASRTRYYPDIGAPALRLGAAYNLATHTIAEQFSWQPLRKLVNQQRTEVLGLAPLPSRGPFRTPRWRSMPVLHGFSPTLVPPAPDWGDNRPVTGYWFGERDSRWSPPRDLATFLEAGPPPVYVGFGSMPDRRPRELKDLVVTALRRAGVRGVISAGWAGLEAGAADDGTLVIGDVPHEWLFPRVAAVVHHGGAGTTHTGVAAGVPSVIVPFFMDQPFWGRRVARLGLGPEPIPRRRITTDALATALTTCVTDTALRSRTARTGRKVIAEHGIREAVAFIERRVASGGHR